MSHVVGIVGHTSRTDLINNLAATVRPEVVGIDDGALGCEGNHRAVWRQLADNYPDARWTVVLEDDAIPVDNFDTQLEAALKVAPTPVVSLYLGRLRPPQHQAAIAACIARHDNAHWFVAKRLLHAVGVAIRTQYVHRMLTHLDTYPTCTRPIDEAIARWVIVEHLAVSYTWPSLVDHADTPTVITKHPDGAPRTAGRIAWRAGERSEWNNQAAELRLGA